MQPNKLATFQGYIKNNAETFVVMWTTDLVQELNRLGTEITDRYVWSTPFSVGADKDSKYVTFERKTVSK